MKNTNHPLIGKTVYGVIYRGLFGKRVILGYVTQVTHTSENVPLYEITSGNNVIKTTIITSKREDLLGLLDIPYPDGVDYRITPEIQKINLLTNLNNTKLITWKLIFIILIITVILNLLSYGIITVLNK